MKEAQDFRTGNIMKLGSDLLLITQAVKNKGARTGSVVKFKLKNLTTGSTSEAVYKPDDKLNDVRLDKKQVQFLYKSNNTFTFMDQEEYEQIELSRDDLGDNLNYLTDDMFLDMFFYEGTAISVEMPSSVELKITYTENAVRSNTSGKVMKAATLETGYEIQVPIFCNTDDVIRVDTRTGEYLERA